MPHRKHAGSGFARTLSVHARGFTRPDPLAYGHMRLPCRSRGWLGWGARARMWCWSAGTGWPGWHGGCCVRCRLAERGSPVQVVLLPAWTVCAGNSWRQGPAAPSGWPAASLDTSRRPAPGEACRKQKKNEQWESWLAGSTPSPSVVSGVLKHRSQRKGNGVRSSRLWGKLLGCENTVIEDVDWHEEDSGDAAGPQLRLRPPEVDEPQAA